MKKQITLMASALTLISAATFAQDIHPSEVPSVVANNFRKEFPKASDIEWELDGDNYNVDFEIGWGTDHEIWYDAAGNMLKHEEEISKGDLPNQVTSKINSDFKDLRIDGAKKITEGSQVTYKVELENFTEEWKVIFSATGEVLHKIND
ncbi:Putative beta-lactamase-inhibitor-like, PepSY-like [Algoriphagus locisalis]|uniref:Putative beta-lactamase-inhibitor-like, PepSY-like n=1 Tax=Algoriphagus locisalis TaxID=305507 RepID=A0A1I7DBL9_9BACT|nr:PepSY-like domain-containing protein [Algoriphagus locisalis]SFU09081.1 Putative beta-lactamase-inhibitor-like, PepSY-like [Algoriphagus locisalis]